MITRKNSYCWYTNRTNGDTEKVEVVEFRPESTTVRTARGDEIILPTSACYPTWHEAHDAAFIEAKNNLREAQIRQEAAESSLLTIMRKQVPLNNLKVARREIVKNLIFEFENFLHISSPRTGGLLDRDPDGKREEWLKSQERLRQAINAVKQDWEEELQREGN